MALGPGWFYDHYKDKTVEELAGELVRQLDYFDSKELEEAEQNAGTKGLDIAPRGDTKTAINVLRELIAMKLGMKEYPEYSRSEETENASGKENSNWIQAKTISQLETLKEYIDLSLEELEKEEKSVEEKLGINQMDEKEKNNWIGMHWKEGAWVDEDGIGHVVEQEENTQRLATLMSFIEMRKTEEVHPEVSIEIEKLRELISKAETQYDFDRIMQEDRNAKAK